MREKSAKRGVSSEQNAKKKNSHFPAGKNKISASASLILVAANKV
jgi:hypothetical protein